jgi:hypothetical protein
MSNSSLLVVEVLLVVVIDLVLKLFSGVFEDVTAKRDLSGFGPVFKESREGSVVVLVVGGVARLILGAVAVAAGALARVLVRVSA